MSKITNDGLAQDALYLPDWVKQSL